MVWGVSVGKAEVEFAKQALGAEVREAEMLFPGRCPEDYLTMALMRLRERARRESQMSIGIQTYRDALSLGQFAYKKMCERRRNPGAIVEVIKGWR